MNFSVILKVFINLGKIKRKLIKNLMWMKEIDEGEGSNKSDNNEKIYSKKIQTE